MEVSRRRPRPPLSLSLLPGGVSAGRDADGVPRGVCVSTATIEEGATWGARAAAARRRRGAQPRVRQVLLPDHEHPTALLSSTSCRRSGATHWNNMGRCSSCNTGLKIC